METIQFKELEIILNKLSSSGKINIIISEMSNKTVIKIFDLDEYEVLDEIDSTTAIGTNYTLTNPCTIELDENLIVNYIEHSYRAITKSNKNIHLLLANLMDKKVLNFPDKECVSENYSKIKYELIENGIQP